MKYRNYILITVGFVILISVIGFVQMFSIEDSSKNDDLDTEISKNTDVEFIRHYQECGTEKRFNQNYPPEIFKNMEFIGFSEEKLKNFLPDQWNVAKFEADRVILEHQLNEKYKLHTRSNQNVDDSADDFEGYISIYRGKIAVYKGKPPEGKLVEVTRYDVKDVYFKELREGIKFEDQREKEQIMENYTS